MQIYASGIMVAGKSKSDAVHGLTEVLESVSKWLVENTFSLHLVKT
jgi:hypothetical protein